jgi:hypothetical protein
MIVKRIPRNIVSAQLGIACLQQAYVFYTSIKVFSFVDNGLMMAF